MPIEKATLIDTLIDAAEFAAEVLENYADVEDGDDGVPVPNRAMLAYGCLERSLEVFRRHRKEQEEMEKMGTRF
jgi:hypothetical protein